MKIIDVLNEAKEKLAVSGVENGLYEARLFLANVLKKSVEWIMIHIEDEIEKTEKEVFDGLIDRRIKGEPFQYIVGNCCFFGYDFLVNESVLVPRADTEVWVEKVIKLAKEIKANSILDLCTGSGCIAITLKKELKDVLLYGVDISEKALAVAKENAKINNADVKFILSDLFNDLPMNKFDIIVSNPPYIPSKEIQTLAKDVQREPIIALDGGEDGLEFYRKIIKKAKEFLEENGYLALEFGHDQAEKVEKILLENEFEVLDIIKDYSGNTRAIISKKGEKQ